MYTNSEQMPPNEAANGAANSTPETGGALRVRLGVQPRTFQKVWKRTFGYPFDSGRIVTDSERDAMEAKYLKPVEEKPEPKPRAKKQAAAMTHSAEHTMSIEQGPVNVSAPQDVNGKRSMSKKVVLAGVCVLCAVVSVSNMLEISLQIKDIFWVAAVLTSIFTVAPFAVFYADVTRFASWLVSGICISYEVFCNTVGIYRGLANLGQGVPYEVWEPGGFIDSVSRVTTIDARPCALFISTAMAAIVAGLFLICLIELKK